MLSDDERLRLIRFHTVAQRERFIVGRGLLRELLGQRVGYEPTALRFHYGTCGKPTLMGDRDALPFYFNLAHSGDRLLIAMTRCGEVGVDIEALPVQIDLAFMARRILTPRERAHWTALPIASRTRALLTYWTRKEAYLKGIGCGLARRLNEINVSATTPRDAIYADPWQVYDMEAGDHYVAAVALAGSLSPAITLHRYADVACPADIDYRTA